MNKYDYAMQKITKFLVDAKVSLTYYDVSSEEIEDAEIKIGYRLPSDYREFIRSYGGAFVATGIDVIKSGGADERITCEIESFYGINHPNSSKDLVNQYYSLKDITPEKFLRICTGGEGFVSLCLAGECEGSVYFVHWEDNSGSWDSINMIADSFDILVTLLQQVN